MITKSYNKRRMVYFIKNWPAGHKFVLINIIMHQNKLSVLELSPTKVLQWAE